MSVTSFLNRLLIKVGIKSPLSFDQQVWGAKSVIDLVQRGSQFLLAEGTAGADCYTAWSGSKTKAPVAIVVDSTGHATGPFPDDSKTAGCEPWKYPPKFSCAQAVDAMAKAGVTEAWTTCTLKQITGQKNPTYTFSFAQHAPVVVDATTGKII
jgi:hypothetical protein